MSICERLNIPHAVYSSWVESIEALLNSPVSLTLKEIEVDYNYYTIDRFFIEYSILKDLESTHKAKPIFQTWMSALKKQIALKRIEGLRFL